MFIQHTILSMKMLSFEQPDPYDVYVLSYMNDVEILYKAPEFTFSMTYKTIA